MKLNTTLCPIHRSNIAMSGTAQELALDDYNGR
ncbi:hypothetical protein HDF16_000516 [Granulicella aggregans]|uniref:Uncharacterized protein n=1 Tax=Granulicella aggregans TaxID=474949 RepID=A0A7W8E1W0_9BACT|nr:hypothetical protein [Granulicella aggregans]